VAVSRVAAIREKLRPVSLDVVTVADVTVVVDVTGSASLAPASRMGRECRMLRVSRLSRDRCGVMRRAMSLPDAMIFRGATSLDERLRRVLR
jgi:hypothetical protein